MGPTRLTESRQDLSLIRARLAARTRDTLALPEFRPSAVLVPIVVREGEARLVFTLRSAELRGHAGQISFPGGGCEPADVDFAGTALREAHEEIGLEPSTVDVLGLLDDIPTPTGFVITPVVGVVAPAPDAYRANAGEVAEVFEVAIERLRAPGVFEEQGEVERWGRTYRLCAFQIDGRRIWGATARMAATLLGIWQES